MSSPVDFCRSNAVAVFDDFEKRLAQYRTRRAEQQRVSASGFSVFDFIRPSENVLSDVLRFLLDPAESHGQGCEFLRLLLTRVRAELKTTSLEKATLTRESLAYSIQSHRRRIDLLITTESFTLGIEVKKFAKEGVRQIEDYCKHLRNVAGANQCLIFLTRTGAEATSLTTETRSKLSKANLLSLSWESDIPAWLRECREFCKADKVRHFLDDFQAYIGTYLSTAGELPENDEQSV